MAPSFEDQAGAIRDRYDRDVARLRNLPSMHAAARRVHLARAFTEARERMRRLGEADQAQRVAAEVASNDAYHRKAASADTMAWRDAKDRAAKYTRDQANAAGRDLVSASQAGDQSMVAAIGRRAAQEAARVDPGEMSEWEPVLRAYLDATGQRQHAEKATRDRGLAARMGRLWISLPDELRPGDEWQAAALAQQDPDDAARAADRARLASASRPRW